MAAFETEVGDAPTEEEDDEDEEDVDEPKDSSDRTARWCWLSRWPSSALCAPSSRRAPTRVSHDMDSWERIWREEERRRRPTGGRAEAEWRWPPASRDVCAWQASPAAAKWIEHGGQARLASSAGQPGMSYLAREPSAPASAGERAREHGLINGMAAREHACWPSR